MKHKLEIWKYTAYEYEEATAHLNDMAAKGWTLQDIATVWLPVACYEKDEAAASYRFGAWTVPGFFAPGMRMQSLCLQTARSAGKRHGRTIETAAGRE